jgi:chloramphenicol O-acetyltransferase type A
VSVDCTDAYQFSKANGVPFFLYYLHKCLTAANKIEPFKYRIEGDEVFIYDRINAGATVARDNGTFGFGYFYFYDSIEDFVTVASEEIKRVKGTTELARSSKNDLIRCSALPWLDFTSISHARSFSVRDSCPKISFGKLTDLNGKKTMPVSVHVHHALVDGIHVGEFIDCFQQSLNGNI